MMASQITVFVCGPDLSGEALDRITIRDRAVVWGEGDEPAPTPVEPIREVHYLHLKKRLALVVTEQAWYLTLARDIDHQLITSSTAPAAGAEQQPEHLERT